jgi:hypothetical protein
MQIMNLSLEESVKSNALKAALNVAVYNFLRNEC